MAKMFHVHNNEPFRIWLSKFFGISNWLFVHIFVYSSRHLKHSVTLDIHRYPTALPNSGTNRDLPSLLSSTGTVSTEDSSTCSDSSISYRSHPMKHHMPYHLPPSNSNRNFVDLAQLGHYVEPKPFIRQITGSSSSAAGAVATASSNGPFYEMTNSSMLAVKGSPTNTFVWMK